MGAFRELSQPTGTYGDLWEPMGSSLRPMGTYGGLLVFADLSGPMGTYRDLWGPMGVYEDL